LAEAHDLDHAILEAAVSWLRRSLGPSEQPHVIFSSARPAFADELPRSLAALRADVVIAFQDVDPASGRHRIGALARRILDGSERPVLLLQPGRRLAAIVHAPEKDAVAAL